MDSLVAVAVDTEVVVGTALEAEAERGDTESVTEVLLPSPSRPLTRPRQHRTHNTPLQHRLPSKRKRPLRLKLFKLPSRLKRL